MTETADAHVTVVSDQAGSREAKRLLSLYEELDAIDPHIAAVIREEPVEGGGLYETWELFIEALEEAVKDQSAAQHVLEERSAELCGRNFRLLAAEFEHLVTDHLVDARDALPIRERADAVLRLFAELRSVDEARATDLLARTIHHAHPCEMMRGGATYEQVLEAFEKASAKSWDNIEADPNGLAVVIFKSDLPVMEAELREQLRATGAVVAL